MPIIFFDDDADGVVYPNDDALVVTMDIVSHNMARIMVDTRSLVDIIFDDTFSHMDIKSIRMHPWGIGR